MDVPTQNHLAALRDLLLYRLRDLTTEVRAGEQASRVGAAAGEARDQKDEADRVAAAAIGNAELQRDLDEAAEVRAALHRLDAGLYGDCIDCGEPIPLDRLRVQPAAARCAACQAGYERSPL